MLGRHRGQLGDRDLADAIPMRKLPQALVNVQVADRGALAGAPAVDEAVDRETASLDGRGRILLRPSGTEPVVRVMVEAPTHEEADEVAASLEADEVAARLAKSVQDALARVTGLLRQHRLVEGLVREQQEQPTAEDADAPGKLAESAVYKKSDAALQRELDLLHPADVAYILEALPPDERMYIWDRVRASRDGVEAYCLFTRSATRVSFARHSCASGLLLLGYYWTPVAEPTESDPRESQDGHRR